MSNGYRVAVVGATGQVGTLMLRLLRERAFPASEIVAFASARSVGRVLEGAGPDGADLTVQGLDEESIQGFDLALFSAGGATSGEWAPRFAAAGAVVVGEALMRSENPEAALRTLRGDPAGNAEGSPGPGD
jgi:aspartate-semialdehyde dehydrogenase